MRKCLCEKEYVCVCVYDRKKNNEERRKKKNRK